MKRKEVFLLFTVIIIFITLLFSCNFQSETSNDKEDSEKKSQPDDGIIVVNLTNAGTYDNLIIHCFAYNHGDTPFTDPHLASGSYPIIAGQASVLLEGQIGTYVFSGGNDYHIYAIIDVGNDFDPITGPQLLDLIKTEDVMNINGNMTINLDISDFVTL